MSYPNNPWNQPPGQKENVIRRPNVATESRVLNIINKQNQSEQLDTSAPQTQAANDVQPPAASQQSNLPLTLPEMPSQLSANAEVFVPRFQNVGATYLEDAPALSASAEEFVPRTGEEYNEFYGYEKYGSGYLPNQLLDGMRQMNVRDSYGSGGQAGAGSGRDTIVDHFKYALLELNMNPAGMEDYLRPICGMIESSSPEDSQSTMNTMVEALFEQSILEPNFRYTGARICQFLNTKLKGNSYFSGFYKVFMHRCQQGYDKREELINGSDDDRKRLMGLAMFLAEIFLNVEIQHEEGTLSHQDVLPKILIDFTHTLLSHPMELEVKCCCQLLKLSGGLIEDKAKESPEMCGLFEDIFSQLTSLKTRSELPNNTRVLVGSVIQLKEKNWNRSASSPPKKSMYSFATEQNTYQQDSPLYFTQNGEVYSGPEAGFPGEEGPDNTYVLTEEEEAAFREWKAAEGITAEQQPAPFNDTGYDSYHLDEIPDEGGMGEELEEAFEEFLQEQQQTSRPSQGAQGGGGHHRYPQHYQGAQQHHHPHHQQQPPYGMYLPHMGGSEFYNPTGGAPPHSMMNPGAAPHQQQPPHSGQHPPSQQGFPPHGGNDRYHYTKPH